MPVPIQVTQQFVLTAANAAEFTALLAWWATVSANWPGMVVQESHGQRRLTLTHTHAEQLDLP